LKCLTVNDFSNSLFLPGLTTTCLYGSLFILLKFYQKNKEKREKGKRRKKRRRKRKRKGKEKCYPY
jgi:hypothetical protein